MRQLRLRRALLSGFGVYARPTEFIFPAGPAVWVAPNESGKSTLIAGLTALWFGLPATADPARFGAGRHRSFGAPESFYGELEWEEDGQLYRLYRRVDSHRVRLTRGRDGTVESIFEGEHNPQARSSAATAFAEILRQRLGLSEPHLFSETFCVTQPLPSGDRLGDELQHLLTGSRAARVDEIQNHLFQQVKQLTRRTADLGVARPGTSRPSNQKDDGRIEEIEQRIGRLNLELRESTGDLQQLNTGNRAIEENDARRLEIRASQERRADRLRTLRAWTELDSERRRRSDELARLRAAQGEFATLTREREGLLSAAEAGWARFESAPADLAPRLEQIEQAALALGRLAEAATERNERRTATDGRLAAVRAKIEADYAPLRGRADWVDAQRRLRSAALAQAARRREIETLSGRLAEIAPSIAGELQHFDALEVLCKSVLAETARYERAAANAADARLRLEGRAFLDADDRLVQLRRKLDLEGARKELALELREAKAESGTARELLFALERRQIEVTSGRARARVLALRGWGIAASVLLVGMVIWLAAARELPAPFITGLYVAAMVASLIGLFRAMAQVGTAPPDVGAQEKGAARLSQAESQVRALEAESLRVETEIGGLETNLGPFSSMTASEFAAQEERWKSAQADLDRWEKERDEILGDLFGLEGGTDPRSRPLATLPEPLRPLLRLSPSPPATLGAWLEQLAAIDETGWIRLRRQADEALESDRERDRIEAMLIRLRSEEAQDTSVSRAEADLAPFTLETDPADLERQVLELQQLEREETILAAEVAALAPEVEGNARASATEALEQKLHSLRTDWPIASPGPDLAVWAAAERLAERPARERASRLAALSEREAALLRTHGVSDLAEITGRELEVSAALGLALRDLERLEQEDALLAASREERDPLRRGEMLRAELQRETTAGDEEESELERLAEANHALLREQARLEGKRGVNVARIELELKPLQAELSRLRREAAGLALAASWLREAATEFQGRHREELEARITERFRFLSGRDDRRVLLDPSFTLSLVGSTGHPIAIEQLSQGARDQLFLALRLAVADLLAGPVPLPFLFDDPFVHSDEERLGRVRESLERLARERQWVLLSHRESFASWGEAIRIRAL
ncbi:MAG: hypothetical protein IPK72_17395 [Candidatus Eisenbacteria bacterium]|nr:hypothetical protein [Candidatus Eisenbacteria bacterium]